MDEEGIVDRASVAVVTVAWNKEQDALYLDRLLHRGSEGFADPLASKQVALIQMQKDALQ